VTIRVVIADDQALVRGGFRKILDSEPDIEVVAEAADGAEAVTLAERLRPDIVLMDIRMPRLDGIAATRRILATAADGVRVLVLTTYGLDDYVLEALRAGASGFLGKGVDPEELLSAIRIVALGDALLSAKATRGLITRFLAQPAEDPAANSPQLALLTEREREVVVLVAQGLSNDDIAERLFVSPLTAKTHVNRAMTKLGARDRAQVVVIAYQSGLVNPHNSSLP
jgi:DNA-binding NarL/FixJ family response regulator